MTHSMFAPVRPILRGFAVVVTTACAGANDSAPASDSTQTATIASCFRTAGSVLGRDSVSAMSSMPASTGMIRLDSMGAGRVSGIGVLTDDDTVSMPARWSSSGDTVVIDAFNDFVTISIRVRVAGDSIIGTGVATSDAVVPPNSADGMFKRQFNVRGNSVRCPESPAPAVPESQ